jgi:hypothetical protein
MTITLNRPTYRRIRPTFAEKVADRFDAREAVSVTVVEYGPGWWVTAVDRVGRTFEVYRDGGSMTVAWTAVNDY